jgi:hypothetical protein
VLTGGWGSPSVRRQDDPPCYCRLYLHAALRGACLHVWPSSRSLSTVPSTLLHDGSGGAVFLDVAIHMIVRTAVQLLVRFDIQYISTRIALTTAGSLHYSIVPGRTSNTPTHGVPRETLEARKSLDSCLPENSSGIRQLFCTGGYPEISIPSRAATQGSPCTARLLENPHSTLAHTTASTAAQLSWVLALTIRGSRRSSPV